jgi:hypothetical protein
MQNIRLIRQERSKLYGLLDKRKANYQANQTREMQNIRLIRQERCKISGLSDKREANYMAY